MRFSLFILFFLLTFNRSFSQADKNDLHFPEIIPKEITLGVPDTQASINQEISGLLVIDARYDSTVLGFYKNLANKSCSIVAGTNTVSDISGFMKKYLAVKESGNGNGPVIIMVLKKLWLTDELQEDKSAKNQSGPWLKGAIANFEFYCGNGDGYIPLYRFDMANVGTKDIRSNAKEYLQDVLMASVEKLITTEFKNIPVIKNKMSLKEIEVYSKRQFNVPIVSSETYKKGVYKTFDEFKSNNPAFSNYEIKKDKFSQMIFIKDVNGEYAVRDVWGYCDGSHLYIKSADNYFELIKKQNTFITIGVKTISKTRTLKLENVIALGLFAGGTGKSNKKVLYSLNYKLYELDMDTGELY